MTAAPLGGVKVKSSAANLPVALKIGELDDGHLPELVSELHRFES